MITVKQEGATAIRCSYDTRNKLRAIKIKTNKASIEEVLKDLIKRGRASNGNN